MVGALFIAALEFGNAAMLGWLAAAALPWLINLWSRNRYEETPWAAIELLLEALRHESRRIRMHNWLLLAIRTALLAMAALAVAQPLWRSDGTSPLRGAVHRVVVVDCSASMAATDGEATRLERARDAARETIAGSEPGDALTVIVWGANASDVLGRPVQVASQALAAVDAVEQQATHANLSVAISAIEAALSRARADLPHLAGAEVIWLTDRAESTWNAALPSADDGADDGVHQRWQALCERARMTFPLKTASSPQNYALVDLRLDPPVAVAGGAHALVAQVRAFPAEEQGAATVELLADGSVFARQTCQFTAEGNGHVRFALPPLAAGEHAWQARLVDSASHGDALPLDDERRFAIRARPRPRVACIEDAASAADEIARALNPHGPAAPGGPAVVRIASGSLAATPLGDFSAVVLCNVARVSPREADLLRRYVGEGGALLVVLGDRVERADYNQAFGPHDGDSRPLLPRAMGESQRGEVWKIEPQAYAHRILQPFAGRERAGLLSVAINRYVSLQPWASDIAPRAGGQVVAAVAGGDPLLVLHDFGRGRTAVLAVDPALRNRGGDPPGTNLAISPSFVPLMQRLLESLLARSHSELQNVTAGEPLLLPTGATAMQLAWRTPQGEQIAQPAAIHGVADRNVAATTTHVAGFYRLTTSTANAADDATLATYAVNADVRESNLAACDEQLLRVGGAATAADAASRTATTAPRSAASLALLAALALLVAERVAVGRLSGGPA